MPEFPRITIGSLAGMVDKTPLVGEIQARIAGGLSPVEKPSKGPQGGTYWSARMDLEDETGRCTAWVDNPSFDPTQNKGRLVSIRPKLNGKGQWSGLKTYTHVYGGRTLTDLSVRGEAIELEGGIPAGAPGPSVAPGAWAPAAPTAPPPGVGTWAPPPPQMPLAAPQSPARPQAVGTTGSGRIASLEAAEALYGAIYGRMLDRVLRAEPSGLTTGEAAERAGQMSTTLFLAVLKGDIPAPPMPAAGQPPEDDELPF